MYCNVLYCIVLYCIVLYCIVCTHTHTLTPIPTHVCTCCAVCLYVLPIGLGLCLYKDGYHNITNIDISPTVVQQMTLLMRRGTHRINEERGRGRGRGRGEDHEPCNLDCKSHLSEVKWKKATFLKKAFVIFFKFFRLAFILYLDRPFSSMFFLPSFFSTLSFIPLLFLPLTF